MTDRYRALGSALYDKQTTNWKKCIGNFRREEECKDICNRLNALTEENKRIKSILNELQEMIQYDVDNGIPTYPKHLSEYLANALKEVLK